MDEILPFLVKLLNIVFLDLILAGDNAIVIGLAARNLPNATQKKAILYGTSGAILLRIIATVLVVKLLDIPWLMLTGGILLVYIAYKLLSEDDSHDNVKAEGSLWKAVRSIIIADAAMGLDNVIAVAGAAQHNIILVIIGLLISVPIVVWGSTLFIKVMDRWPWIIYIGSAVLGYTAASMITDEKSFVAYFEAHPVLKVLFCLLVISAILVAGYMTKRASQRKKQAERLLR